MLGAVRTVVVPEETSREVVDPDTVWLTLEVVVPETVELIVWLAGLLTVNEEFELPFPRLLATARAPELASAPEMPVPTAVLDWAKAAVDSKHVMVAAAIILMVMMVVPQITCVNDVTIPRLLCDPQELERHTCNGTNAIIWFRWELSHGELTMRKIVLLLAVAAGLVTTAIPADAGTHCTTTCSGYGNSRTCSTYCY
jgi:hypothetical protein